MRENEREWERMREREKESIRDQPKREKKMACNGVDCRGGSFFFFIYTLKQKKKKRKKRTMEKVRHQCLDLFRDRIPNYNNLTCIILTGTSCDVYKKKHVVFGFREHSIFHAFKKKKKKKKRNGYKNWKIK